MEMVIGLIVAVVVIALIYFNRSSSGLDVNNDGKIDIQDAKDAVDNTVKGVKKTVRKTTTKPSSTGRGRGRGRKPKKVE